MAEPSAGEVPANRSVLATAKPIREYHGVDRALFQDRIRADAQPAVLRGLAASWPAVEAARQSDEALVSYLAGFPIGREVGVIVGDPAIRGRFFYGPDLTTLNFQRGRSAFVPVLERLLRDRADPQPYAMAIQSELLTDLVPGFADRNRLDILAPTIPPRAWIGNRIRVATHYDLQENVGIVVAGRRRFLLFPADQIANMYVGPLEVTPAGTPVSLVDPLYADLARFPRFAEAMAQAQVATLEPGDAIYIPFHWWHAVDSLTAFNMFVNYWWNDVPAGLGNGYDALMHAIFSIRNLPADQRAVWRRTFDHYVFRAGSDAAAHLPESAQGILGQPNPSRLGRMRATLKQVLAKL